MPPRSSWGPGAAAPLGQSWASAGRHVLCRVTRFPLLIPTVRGQQGSHCKAPAQAAPLRLPSWRGRGAGRDQRRRSSHGLVAPVSRGGCDQESAGGCGMLCAPQIRANAERPPARSRPGPSSRTRDYASQRPPRPCGGAVRCGSCSPRVGAPSLAEWFRRPRALHFPLGSAAGPAAETFASLDLSKMAAWGRRRAGPGSTNSGGGGRER